MRLKGEHMPWESIVMLHLTTKENFLVCPQYNISWDKQTKTGGTCPDFIAIHPDRPRRVYVVEVSASYDLKNLNDRFMNRRQYWYDPIDRTFSLWGHRGPFAFTSIAFIRKDSVHFSCEASDIIIRYLEDITFSWDPKLQSPSLT